MDQQHSEHADPTAALMRGLAELGAAVYAPSGAQEVTTQTLADVRRALGYTRRHFAMAIAVLDDHHGLTYRPGLVASGLRELERGLAPVDEEIRNFYQHTLGLSPEAFARAMANTRAMAPVTGVVGDLYDLIDDVHPGDGEIQAMHQGALYGRIGRAFSLAFRAEAPIPWDAVTARCLLRMREVPPILEISDEEVADARLTYQVALGVAAALAKGASGPTAVAAPLQTWATAGAQVGVCSTPEEMDGLLAGLGRALLPALKTDAAATARHLATFHRAISARLLALGLTDEADEVASRPFIAQLMLDGASAAYADPANGVFEMEQAGVGEETIALARRFLHAADKNVA